MRFHLGVSFSWRSIKKYLIPILLGILAYFGFNYIYDNHNVVPLGFIQVNALENYDSTTTISYSKLDILDTKVDDNLTYNQLFEHINNIESNYYKLIIGLTFNETNSYNISAFTLQLIPNSVASIPVSIFIDYNNNLKFRPNSSSEGKFYKIDLSVPYSDILNDSHYLEFLNCYTTNSCSNVNGSAFNNSYSIGSCNFDNSDKNTSSTLCSLPFHVNYSSDRFGLIYSNNIPFYLNNTFSLDNSRYYYKTLVYNDKNIESGDYFPSYVDYINSIPVQPDNPDNPDLPDDSIEHKKIFNKIYWFDYNTSVLGVLSSIYILLFLYCISMIILKILTIIKNSRW